MAYDKNKSAGAKPKTYWAASTPVEYEDKQGEVQTQWTRIGTAFPNKSGGFTIQLAATPVNGKIVISEFEEKAER